ncbi:MAG: pantoate--beta-alanine ligase [Phycisphaera sp.]|nr:pantoate--beta-alanine ligase [Phycisphaera sp.]
MWVTKTVEAVRRARGALRGRVALVPTMGALHAGHVALIEHGGRIADHVIVSVFVNPTQFGPNEDFTRYPRPFARDVEMAREAGAVGVFAPDVEEVYPPGDVACDVSVPALAGDLEGAQRPGHFAGVCRVVAKLLHMVSPDVACFGQKDYQQLRIVEAMARDLAMPYAIEAVPTVREPDGLALSSRNAYLSPEDRAHAVGLYRALCEARRMVENPNVAEADPRVVEAAMRQFIASYHLVVDYAELRHAKTLAKLETIDPAHTPEVVALVAARCGPVRLLDNTVLHVVH